MRKVVSSSGLAPTAVTSVAEKRSVGLVDPKETVEVAKIMETAVENRLVASCNVEGRDRTSKVATGCFSTTIARSEDEGHQTAMRRPVRSESTGRATSAMLSR